MKTNILFLTGFFLLLFSSCKHKELSYNYSYTSDVQVVFDWRNAPGVNPETMRLYLFPPDGKQALAYEFTDMNGGRISVPAGHYKAICLNSDTEYVLYRNIDSFNTFEAYASEGSLEVHSSSVPPIKGATNERIAKSPDALYCGRLDNVTIQFSQDEQTLTFVPELSVCRYRVEIKNVSNLQYVASDGFYGALTSMAGGMLIGPDKLTTELVTVPFGVTSDGISAITADFLVFGHYPSVLNPHQLVIYAVMSDGSKNYYTYDVTTQIHNAPNFRDVHILLDGLSLPKPIVNGGGFQPSVDEWTNTEVELTM